MVSIISMNVNKTKIPATKGFTFIADCRLWNMVHGKEGGREFQPNEPSTMQKSTSGWCPVQPRSQSFVPTGYKHSAEQRASARVLCCLQTFAEEESERFKMYS